jgi:uncharacterized repeat protein (TIGR01451 family)
MRTPSKYLFVFLLSFIFFSALVTSAYADVSAGTQAGTVITANATDLEITYTDTGSNAQPTVNALADITATVSAIYGLDGGTVVPDVDNVVLAGGATTYTVYFRNVGNISDTVSFNYDTTATINYQGLPGTDWEVSPLSATSQLLSEFAVATVSFTVTASMDAGNGSKGFVTVNASTGSLPVGAYTGFNTNLYGGAPTYSYTTMTTVSGPDVVIVTKNLLLVTAPTANGYDGGDNDVVPGAKLTYQVVLKNQGTTANAVALEQAIPAHTDYLKGSMGIVGSAGLTPLAEFFNGSFNTDSGSTTDVSVTRIRFSFTEMKNGSGTPQYVTLNYTVVVK